MVGRCIPYWNSPLDRGHVSFGGVDAIRLGKNVGISLCLRLMFNYVERIQNLFKGGLLIILKLTWNLEHKMNTYIDGSFFFKITRLSSLLNFGRAKIGGMENDENQYYCWSTQTRKPENIWKYCQIHWDLGPPEILQTDSYCWWFRNPANQLM